MKTAGLPFKGNAVVFIYVFYCLVALLFRLFSSIKEGDAKKDLVLQGGAPVENDDSKTIKTLDVKDLTCPIPLIQTKRTLEKMKPGEILEVLCNSADTAANVPGWCEKSGYLFLGDKQEEDHTKIYIKKG